MRQIKGLLVFLLSFFLLALNLSAQCGAPSDVGGVAFSDIDSDGIQDSNERPQDGVLITVTNSAGVVVGTATTAADGLWVVDTGVTTGNFRIVATTPSAIYPTFQASGSQSSVVFSSPGNCAINFGYNYPLNYCEDDPRIAVACYAPGDPLAAGSFTSTEPGLVSILKSYDGQWMPPIGPPTEAAPTMLATLGETGATYGLAHQRTTNTLFSSAYIKRHTGFGPLGIGGIYATDLDTNTTSSFVDLAALGINFGPFTRAPGDLSTDTVPFFPEMPFICNLLGASCAAGTTGTESPDMSAFIQVGRQGIGEIAVSEDQRYLWVTNIFLNSLHRIFIDSPAVVPTVGDVTTFAVPDPGCSNAEYRIMAVEPHNGFIYVGGICTAETSADINDLRAFVYELDESTGVFTNVIDFQLNFNRGTPNGNIADGTETFNNYAHLFPFPTGCATFLGTPVSLVYPALCPVVAGILVPGFPGLSASSAYTGFQTWNDDPSTYANYDSLLFASTTPGPLPAVTVPGIQNTTAFDRSSPLFAQISFDQNDNMYIGLGDRSAHQSSYLERIPDGMGGMADMYVSPWNSGDLLIAGYNGPTASPKWTLESNAAITNFYDGPLGPTAGAGNSQGNGGGEFYSEETISPTTGDNETAQGGMRVHKQSGHVMLAVIDPLRAVTQGITNFNGDTGVTNSRYEVVPTVGLGEGQPGKGAGLGTLEMACAPAPIQIGNRVWIDTNSNGVQDAGESPVSGVTVSLYDAAMTTRIATTTTDSSGHYLFSTVTTPAISFYTSYKVVLDNPADFTSGGGLSGYALTAANSGSADALDSDGTLSSAMPVYAFSIGAPGHNDHTFDFGFVTAPSTLSAAPQQLAVDSSISLLHSYVSIARNNRRSSAVVRRCGSKSVGNRLTQAAAAYNSVWNSVWVLNSNYYTSDPQIPFTTCTSQNITALQTNANSSIDTIYNIITYFADSCSRSSGTVGLKSRRILSRANRARTSARAAVTAFPSPYVTCS